MTRTERVHAQALALLERHGVLTREAVAGEAVDGGFSAVYPVLRALEEAGRIRRGYFVDGLGAAQFALPGAVDRLRALRDQPGVARGESGDEPVVHLLAAADPANPYGAALAVAPPRRGRPAARTSAPPVPTSRWSTARPSCTSTAAAPRSRPSPPPSRPSSSRSRSRSLADLVQDGRVARARDRQGRRRARRHVALPRRAPRRRASSSGYRGFALRSTAPAERRYDRPVPVRPVR